MTTSPAWWSRPPSSATALPPWVRRGLHQLHHHVADVLGRAELAVLPRCCQFAQHILVQVALHIKVGFGLNISTITQSITHRVKDEVELATGLKVARIDVYVDDVIAD